MPLLDNNLLKSMDDPNKCAWRENNIEPLRRPGCAFLYGADGKFKYQFAELLGMGGHGLVQLVQSGFISPNNVVGIDSDKRCIEAFSSIMPDAHVYHGNFRNFCRQDGYPGLAALNFDGFTATQGVKLEAVLQDAMPIIHRQLMRLKFFYFILNCDIGASCKLKGGISKEVSIQRYCDTINEAFSPDMKLPSHYRALSIQVAPGDISIYKRDGVATNMASARMIFRMS